MGAAATAPSTVGLVAGGSRCLLVLVLVRPWLKVVAWWLMADENGGSLKWELELCAHAPRLA